MHHIGEGVPQDDKTAFSYFLRSVDKGSPAFRAGIRQGDEIISINGQKASSLGLKPLGLMLRAKPGARIRVGVQRGEQTRQSQFVLRPSL
jgi:C-terminal processing protease CtpA/Prc